MKIAIAQLPPVFLDRKACLELAVRTIAQAATDGASLLVFPEAFIAGYPVWIWRLRPGTDHSACAALHQRLTTESCQIDSADLAPLQSAAKQHQITVVCGFNERASSGSQTTLYNSVVCISAEGQLLNCHQKLVPTNAERMIWGQGDGRSLRVIDSAAGKLSTLICWENYMPLARYALYAQGVEIYIAPTYDSGEQWLSSMQHIARESGCWVISANNAFQAADLSTDILELTGAYPDQTEWVNPGDSVVIAPGGKIEAGPWRRQKGLFYAEIDTSACIAARRSLDVAGHYARTDLFRLHITEQPSSPVTVHSE
jgi:nitrilase